MRSTRVRARVWIGRREGNERRAWRAFSFADCLEREMGGEGRSSSLRVVCLVFGESEGSAGEGLGSSSENMDDMEN